MSFGVCRSRINIEYATQMAVNGGDLIYVSPPPTSHSARVFLAVPSADTMCRQTDELFRLNSWLPVAADIFPSVLFTIFWLATSAPVSSAYFFATNILLVIFPSAQGPQDLRHWVIIIFGIICVGAICAVFYLSRRVGLFLTVVTAILKVLFLVVVIVAGMRAASVNRDSGSGWKELKPAGSTTSAASSLSAFILVLYSYSGFQNASYVCDLPPLCPLHRPS